MVNKNIKNMDINYKNITSNAALNKNYNNISNDKNLNFLLKNKNYNTLLNNKK